MGHYRKKPVVIEAVQIALGGDVERPSWLADAIATGTVRPWPEGQCYWIDTLEGTTLAKVGDWIIRGIKGELYPCKPDIFEATYEPA